LKKIALTLILASVFLVFVKPAPAVDLTPPESGWAERNGTKEYKTFSRISEGADSGEVMMVGVMDAPPKACFDFIVQYEKFPGVMPYIEYTKRIHSEKINENKTLNYVFFLLTPPIISSRFYTLKLEDESNADGREGVYRSQWDLEKGRFRKTPLDPEIKGSLKNPEKAVETPLNKGYWLYEPIDGGKRTKVTYYVWTNPGGRIPMWVANMGNTIALPKVWNAVKSRVAAATDNKGG
jgi:hypothetical protein